MEKNNLTNVDLTVHEHKFHVYNNPHDTINETWSEPIGWWSSTPLLLDLPLVGHKSGNGVIVAEIISAWAQMEASNGTYVGTGDDERSWVADFYQYLGFSSLSSYSDVPYPQRRLDGPSFVLGTDGTRANRDSQDDATLFGLMQFHYKAQRVNYVTQEGTFPNIVYWWHPTWINDITVDKKETQINMLYPFKKIKAFCFNSESTFRKRSDPTGPWTVDTADGDVYFTFSGGLRWRYTIISPSAYNKLYSTANQRGPIVKTT